MTTTYRYAWLAVLDGNGRKRLNEDLLAMEEFDASLTQQNTPGAIWTVFWDDAPARLATTALGGNVGRDQDIEVLMVSVQGDEKKLREWIDTPQGNALRSHALSVQPWVYSASTA
jgi:hypothetical protein